MFHTADFCQGLAKVCHTGFSAAALRHNRVFFGSFHAGMIRNWHFAQHMKIFQRADDTFRHDMRLTPLPHAPNVAARMKESLGMKTLVVLVGFWRMDL
ncbi:MAG: hypothetical protein N4A61_10485 [Pelagimonas sp.]|jgi:hypothetical protein|nr:hypothetical protein [Pelagimonas sp.]